MAGNGAYPSPGLESVKVASGRVRARRGRVRPLAEQRGANARCWRAAPRRAGGDRLGRRCVGARAHGERLTMIPILARREAERRARIDLARSWATELDRRLAGRVRLIAAVVVGSVARGDFNLWSDLDVLVVADGLPAGGRDRLDLVAACAARPAGNRLAAGRARRAPRPERPTRARGTPGGCRRPGRAACPADTGARLSAGARPSAGHATRATT